MGAMMFFHAAELFGSAFLLVYVLGLQSLNVNNGHIKAAAITSLFVGAGQLALYKLAPSASGVEIVAYLLGGPAGITASMVSHGHFVRLVGLKTKKEGESEKQRASDAARS